MPAVDALYRYPIKGLSAEALTRMSVTPEGGLAHDREYALALGTTPFDPEKPEPLDKGFFLMLRNNTALAALATRLDPATGHLTIRRDGENLFEADLSTEAGRAGTEEFFVDYLGEETRGRPRLVRGENHKFTDASVLSPVMMRAISVVNLASVRALSEATGRDLDPLRFRANIHLDGLEPWQELDWVGREVVIGPVRFRGLARTPRCGAVNVNPTTAERDANLPKAIKQHFGHVDLGIYLEVVEGGTIAPADRLALG
ncbi:MOSC domain-containing protein [Methylobacterium sp. 77]|uniref:MOSC domain-containing protein n=1 Tax=Methylobacterium sp. 77 TaxID=1101192 RepID=UPI00035DC5C2|nr:MOSC domain-containing protein [Methylobacterium sp. 77]